MSTFLFLTPTLKTTNSGIAPLSNKKHHLCQQPAIPRPTLVRRKSGPQSSMETDHPSSPNPVVCLAAFRPDRDRARRSSKTWQRKLKRDLEISLGLAAGASAAQCSRRLFRASGVTRWCVSYLVGFVGLGFCRSVVLVGG